MNQTHKKNLRAIMIFMVLLIGSIVVLLPFILLITGSMKTTAEINASHFKLLPKSLNFSNFPQAFKNGQWGRWFFNTIFISVIATGVSLLINSMAGYAFARLEFRFKKLFFYSVLLGLMVPRQLVNLPTFIIIKNIPLAGGNNILGHGGTGLIDTYLGLMLPIFAGAFGIFLCRQFYLNFPKSLDQAAEIDGCGPISTFFRIYVPNSKTLFMGLGILKFTYSWNDYMWPLTIIQSQSMMTIQLGLSSFKNETIIWENLLAATLVTMLPLMVFFLITQKFVTSGVVTSGMKG